jgi:hypothetical protein
MRANGLLATAGAITRVEAAAAERGIMAQDDPDVVLARRTTDLVGSASRSTQERTVASASFAGLGAFEGDGLAGIVGSVVRDRACHHRGYRNPADRRLAPSAR